jgi:hypothetical protein
MVIYRQPIADVGGVPPASRGVEAAAVTKPTATNPAARNLM